MVLTHLDALGKKYLQIIADEKTAPTQQVEVLKRYVSLPHNFIVSYVKELMRISSNDEHCKQRLSVTFSETTETAGTDELDTWCRPRSAFLISPHELCSLRTTRIIP